MWIPNYRALARLSLTVAAFSVCAHASFISAVDATNPLAFWTLDTTNSPSQVNGYTSTYVNGATEVSALPGSPSANAVSLDGVNDGTPSEVTTSLSGGIPGAGSIMAWVNLDELPSTAGAYFYIAGESQSGNDFDLQFQNDNRLYLYTGGGENTNFAPDIDSLVGNWHMIVATFTGGPSGTRNIYWDGSLVNSFSGGVNSASKSSVFTIGYSSVFGGRDFNGQINNVAVWGSEITGDQVSALYAARNDVSETPEPGSVILLGGGFIAALVARRRRQVRAS